MIFKKRYGLRAGYEHMGLVAQHTEAQPYHIRTPRTKAPGGGRVLRAGHGLGHAVALVQQADHLRHTVHVRIVFGQGVEGHVYMSRKNGHALTATGAGRRKEHAHRGAVVVVGNGPHSGL